MVNDEERYCVELAQFPVTASLSPECVRARKKIYICKVTTPIGYRVQMLQANRTAIQRPTSITGQQLLQGHKMKMSAIFACCVLVLTAKFLQVDRPILVNFLM